MSYKEFQKDGSKFALNVERGELIHYCLEPGKYKERKFFEKVEEVGELVKECIESDQKVRKALNGEVQNPGGEEPEPEVIEDFAEIPDEDELPLKREKWGSHGLTDRERRELRNGGSLSVAK